MSIEVQQFIELINERFVQVEAEKMVKQGRAWCDHCKAWTFPSREHCELCDVCKNNYMDGLA